MYQNFSIKKESGTYSETLEAFGVAKLISNIFSNLSIQGVQIKIEDKGSFYCVSSNKPLTNELLDNLSYFLILKFIKKDASQEVPEGLLVNDYFNYPDQKVELDNYKKRFTEIESNKLLNVEQKKVERKKLAEEKLSEFGKKLDAEFDVYREIIKNPYASFSKLFDNFYQNRDNFRLLVKEILNFYTDQPIAKRSFKLADEKPTSQQLYNPNQGKGLNRGKANNPSMGNLDSNWISETMKISGALDMMVCQYVKVGSSYDLKVFVPEFNDILLHKAKDVVCHFKKHLKSTSPIKLDIINILDFTEKFIKETPEYNKGKVKNTIKGFHSVYQKDLGQNKAVANIAFIQTPDFVEYKNKDESLEWIEILSQQKSLISNIEELGDSMQGLQAYRDFLGSVSNSALGHFSKFNYWYSGYLMQQLTKGNKFVRAFKIEHLNKFYHNMEPKLSEIINNEGFKAVAGAIRRSTVSLQYTPKDQRKFDIRYGLAQQLQNKSKSKEDLATFIGEFISTYNAETGRNAEKNGGKALRANVKEGELMRFYDILDSNPPRLVGALLASYGFALSSKEKVQEPDETEQTQDNQEDTNQ
ncbi:citrate lyase gamma subunit [Runella defluvii]|uniref:Citrate lyase gamma subunit n=1 Tax=Runella defluvii TaxID=370973 RepID=A0A7W6EPU5_9BACT|nr:hypothetical protein [Runella defluvii]MBB3837838.1 citrate lyase gamma subunit [Runella defluvii]